METIYTDAPEVKALALRAFPGYGGRKFKLCIVPDDYRPRLSSYWSGGSKDDFTFVALDSRDKRSFDVPQNGTPFDGQLSDGIQAEIPAQCALVKHSIFMGKDTGLTIFIRQSDAAPMIPAAAEILPAEKIVLVATRNFKSSYAGMSNYRYQEAKRETGMSLEVWNTAKDSCIARGFLNKAGALTDKGRNAAGSASLYSVVRELGLSMPYPGGAND